MTWLLDVNVLIALLWENHEQHQLVRRWFRGIDSFATCPVSQLGFGRISSHPMLGFSITPDAAFNVLRKLLADSRHRFIADDLSIVERVVRTDLMMHSNQVTDLYLAALARQHKCKLATLDAPLSRAFANEPELIGLIR